MECTIILTVLLLIILYPIWEKRTRKKGQMQLVRLVQQAQANLPFDTEWDIAVSPQMRAALCYPLTCEQVRLIANNAHTPEKHCFEYHLLNCEWKKHTLSGVVSVSIEYENTVSGLDLHFENILLSIYCSGKPWEGWHVHSVDIL